MVKATSGDARYGITCQETKNMTERCNEEVRVICVFHIFTSERKFQ